MQLFQRGHVPETITRHGQKCRESGGEIVTENQTWLGSRPAEPRATTKRIGNQHRAARDAAGGPNEGQILTGHSGAEKATPPRYCDYYSFMSLADFMTWIQKNDGSEPGISYSWR